MKRISVFLTEQQIAALQAMAAQSGLKFAEVLRRLIDKAMDRVLKDPTP
jgi:predicted DNA binding CopG/RHH family protein